MDNFRLVPPPYPPQEVLNANELHLMYQQLLGRIFHATYKVLPMPQTGTQKDVLSITTEGPGLSFEEKHSSLLFAKTLGEISRHVLDTSYSQQVWKAFTGPQDVPGQTDYRLWVEPVISRVIPSESMVKFKVENYTVEFDDIGSQLPYRYIVRIWVSIIPQA